jgi:hypothetical protein
VKTGYGEVESKVPFPLPHTLDGDEILMVGFGIFEPKQMLVFGKISREDFA